MQLQDLWLDIEMCIVLTMGLVMMRGLFKLIFVIQKTNGTVNQYSVRNCIRDVKIFFVLCCRVGSCLLTLTSVLKLN